MVFEISKLNCIRKMWAVKLTDKNLKRGHPSKQLCYDDAYTFLGVYLDSILSMNRHIQYLRARALKIVPLLKCLAGRGCGADGSVLHKIYQSLI